MSIGRHYPEAGQARAALSRIARAVIAAQAELIARWMLVGFIHGVMNTDNMAISGETIDYGPCAFMDAYDPAKVFSSIDQAAAMPMPTSRDRPVEPDAARRNAAAASARGRGRSDGEAEGALKTIPVALRDGVPSRAAPEARAVHRPRSDMRLAADLLEAWRATGPTSR